MTTTPTYTGDLLLQLNTDQDWDINYITGQPEMTDGFNTSVLLSVFGEPDFWQNDLTNDPAEKYISEFPEIIANANVTDETMNNGIAAIKKSLKWMIDVGIAQSLNVTGGFLNIHSIYWTIEIMRANITNRYEVNWDKGVIAVTAKSA